MGGKGSGRTSIIKELQENASNKSKAELMQDSMSVLRASAPYAAKYLRDVVRKSVSKPSWARIHVCEFILEHILGKPPQRHEITGAGGTPLTWQAIVLLAEQAPQVEIPPQPPQIVEAKDPEEPADEPD